MDLPRWFNYFSVILFLLIVGFSITNAVFYGLEIDNDYPNPPISSSNATILMWINIVLAILSAFAMVYFVWRIYKKKGLATEISTEKTNIKLEAPVAASNPADKKNVIAPDQLDKIMKDIENYNARTDKKINLVIPGQDQEESNEESFD